MKKSEKNYGCPHDWRACDLNFKAITEKYCCTCIHESDAVGPGCDCSHAPCIHDRNARIVELEKQYVELENKYENTEKERKRLDDVLRNQLREPKDANELERKCYMLRTDILCELVRIPPTSRYVSVSIDALQLVLTEAERIADLKLRLTKAEAENKRFVCAFCSWTMVRPDNWNDAAENVLEHLHNCENHPLNKIIADLKCQLNEADDNHAKMCDLVEMMRDSRTQADKGANAYLSSIQREKDMALKQLSKIYNLLDTVWGIDNLIDINVESPEDYVLIIDELIDLVKKSGE